MYNRRKFIKLSAMTASLAAIAPRTVNAMTKRDDTSTLPVVISTWDFGIAANAGAWEVLSKGGRALDAIEAGARIPEADMKNHTVGRAGYPDRDGFVTLDA